MTSERKKFVSRPLLVLALISCAALALCPASAKAQTPASGIDPKVLALAKSGDPKSQLILGYAYSKGDGAPLDLDQASGWYHKAAEGGDATAQFALGWAYLYGGFSEVDHKQASTWFR
jgi:hypothetical protein